MTANSNLKDFVLSGSKVGIGTNKPQSKLHVVGDIWASGSNGHITASGNISASRGIYAAKFYQNGIPLGLGGNLWKDKTTYISSSKAIYVEGIISSSRGITLQNTASLFIQNDQLQLGSQNEAVAFNFEGPGTVFKVQKSGNVGILNNNPTAQLTVGGTISASGDLKLEGFIISPKFINLPTSPNIDKILMWDNSTGKVAYTSSNAFGFGVGNGGVDTDWHVTPTFLTSSKPLIITGSITSSGNLSMSGYIYGDLPVANKYFPVVTYNTFVSPHQGRLELTPNVVVTNISESTPGGGINIYADELIIKGDGINDGVITVEGDNSPTALIVKGKGTFNNNVEITKDLIVGGRIRAKNNHDLTIGDPHKPIKDIHMDRGTIYFYSSSAGVVSSSVEQARLTINELTKEAEFKSGSEFINIKAKDLKLGLSSQTTFTKTDLDNLKLGKSIKVNSVDLQESDSSVNVLKPDAIASSADETTLTKFTTAGRVGHFVSGTLFHDLNLNGSNNYIAMGAINTQLRLTGNITASGNISSSGTIISDITHTNKLQIQKDHYISDGQQDSFYFSPGGGINTFLNFRSTLGSTLIRPEHLGFGNTVASITQKGSGSFEILLDADNFHSGKPYFGIRTNSSLPGLLGDVLFTVSESGETRAYNSLKVDQHLTASGNISGSHTTTASFGSLQLSNLPTTPTGLPTGSVWVSGSKNDSTTNNVNCGTLMIVI
tara:strand:- start:999 stop:3152 length:2154 start_codon:yes stop_codon:yes gene_type:complete